jgi:ribosomal protein S18 acetylase RimI-like enzyme
MNQQQLRSQMASIWAEAFGDNAEFIDYYFNVYDSPDTRIVRCDDEGDGSVIAEMHFYPFLNRTGHGAYIYGVATSAKWRRHGLAESMICESFSRMRNWGATYAVLIAENEDLKRWYASMGFVEMDGVISVRGDSDGFDFGMEKVSENVGLYRIVNPFGFLSIYAAYYPEADFTIRISDPLLPVNNGTYHVSSRKISISNSPSGDDIEVLTPSDLLKRFPVIFDGKIIIDSENS